MSQQLMPGAKWMPLPESGLGPIYTKTQLIYHSTGTKASALGNYKYFARGDINVESTFIVDYDGGILQVMLAGEKADANTTASRRAISVEVVGTGDEPYTPAQVKACIAIGRWACAEHPIEVRQCPGHDESGIGWHVMFGAPGPWTSVRGKVCPGTLRIAQVQGIIIPAIKWTPPPPPPPTPPVTPTPVQEDDMARLLKAPDKGAVFGFDGAVKWHAPNPAVLEEVKKTGIYGDGTVHVVSQATLDAIPTVTSS